MKYIPSAQDIFANSEFDLDQLIDRIDSLEIQLSNGNGRQIAVLFDSHMAHRTLNEGDALVTLDAIADSGRTGKYFYEVENSEFIKWFQSERYETSKGEELKHYCIATVNFMVDVISIDPPTFVDR